MRSLENVRRSGVDTERGASMNNPYENGLDKNVANYAPLSPLTFIERAASTYPDHPALIYASVKRSWADTYRRCKQLASALAGRGIGIGDTVAVMLPNIPEMFEAHYGIPMSGAVLNALNTRLDAATIGFMLEHAGAKAVIADREYAQIIADAVTHLAAPPLVVYVDDPHYDGPGERIGELDYELLLAEGDPDYRWQLPADEWHAISLNYTSGTTGDPKGVVYHHRGAYLNAVSNILAWGMAGQPVYLWTLPMFHCNGWCFPWTLAALCGTNVCLRSVRAEPVFELIKRHQVTHLCGAPVVLNLLVNAPHQLKEGIEHEVKVMTAASAPPAAVLEAMARMGFKVTHVYGLTEVYGPAVVCAWHQEWDRLEPSEQAKLKARQGVRYPMLERLMVGDPETLEPVPPDGASIGEIFFRGNIVMKGYLKNSPATERAFSGGWFHSGDLAVCHPNGYIEIKDRAKDIIISGGENISTIEIEDILYHHPSILEAAVVSKPDIKWGETPCAFVTLRPGHEATTADELINHCRTKLAHFKAPKVIVFGPLPKTSTGKIQKFILRERAKAI